MELAQAWILFIVGSVIIVAIGVGLAFGFRRGSLPGSGPTAPVARAERVRTMPAFRRAVRNRIVALTGVLVIGVLGIVAAGIVAARPTTAETIEPVNTNRDIILCLDVSGSMVDVDVEVVDVFLELIKGFDGERIGLTIFNSSPVQVFPLTDDYEFVRTHLENIRSSFDYTATYPEHWIGTLNGPGASLIGDGLASCVMRFDNLDIERSRSVILATDNEVNGNPIFTLDEASEYAQSLEVRVFSLTPNEQYNPTVSAELARASEATGGAMYSLRGNTTVGDIIDQIGSQEATQLRAEAQVVRRDDPNVWIVLFLIPTLAFTVLLWRVKL